MHVKKQLLMLLICLIGGFGYACAKIAAKYSIPLVRVEVSEIDSADSLPITPLEADDDEVTRSQFEDDNIQVIWKCNGQRFYFVLLNKTEERMTVDWDKIVYIDTEGMTGNVIHNGVNYNRRNEGQLKSILPKSSKISDFLVPSENCFNNGFGWNETFLFPCVYKNKKEMWEKANSYIGSQMRIEMPLLIGDKEVTYTFYFELKELLQKKKKK